MTAEKASAETRKKIVFLKNKARETGEILYDRIVAAHEVFEDAGWVFEVGGIDTATKIIEVDFLPDLCFAVSSSVLFGVLKEFPTKDLWEKFNFNFSRLYAEWRNRLADESKEITPRRRITIAQYEALEEERNNLAYRLHKLQEEYNALKVRYDQLVAQRNESKHSKTNRASASV
jgi:hypothetical protein